jgi:hypothetical protein
VLTLNLRALGEAPVNPALEKLFERGIDPGSADEARRHDRGIVPPWHLLPRNVTNA